MELRQIVKNRLTNSLNGCKLYLALFEREC